MFPTTLPGPGEVRLLWCPTAPGLPHSARRAQLDDVLRAWLGACCGRAPDTLRFAREARGRPYLLDAPSGLDFSLSDTAGGSLLALACGLRLGVDVEALGRRPPVLRLARRYFATDEADALAVIADETLQAHAFLQAWTAKEAACKATGTGLRHRLAAWVFEIDAGKADPRLRAAPPEAGEATGWSLHRLQPAPGFTATLAARGWIGRVDLQRLVAGRGGPDAMATQNV